MRHGTYAMDSTIYSWFIENLPCFVTLSSHLQISLFSCHAIFLGAMTVSILQGSWILQMASFIPPALHSSSRHMIYPSIYRSRPPSKPDRLGKL